MHPVAKVLIGIGLFCVAAGLIWQFGIRFLNFDKLGRLPGDIAVEKENFKFYFPLMSSILISIILSGLVYLIQHFKK